MPRLSVTLCNYNHGRYVGRAIDALVSQSRPPDQIVIVDDGSTDNSVEVIRGYAKRYPSICVDALPVNTRLRGAAQRCMELAQGDYLYFAAADDYVLPGFFEKAMVAADAHPDAGLIMGKMRIVDTHGNVVVASHGLADPHSRYFSPGEFLSDYLRKIGPRHSVGSATIYKMACYRELGGFRPELHGWTDTFDAWTIGLKYGAYRLADECSVWTSDVDSYSGDVGANPIRQLDIGARAAWLMRSPPLVGLFPEAFTSKWESAWRAQAIDAYLARLGNAASSMETNLRMDSQRRSWLFRFLCEVRIAGLRIGRHLHRSMSARLLISYVGDTTCYQSNTTKR